MHRLQVLGVLRGNLDHSITVSRLEKEVSSDPADLNRPAKAKIRIKLG